jgi:outer membrane biosynthesis protein TonB
MTDKSQINDMRAALRGDLERARERRGSTLLDREPTIADLEAEAAAEPEPVAEEPEPEPEVQVSDTPDEASEVVVPVSETTEPEPEPVADEPDPEPKRRFLWFLRD